MTFYNEAGRYATMHRRIDPLPRPIVRAIADQTGIDVEEFRQPDCSG
jgi:hypothetical protein